jgi:hypothetical protein
MLVTSFGSCRIGDINNNTKLNELINYTHSTKEIIQMIYFLQGRLKIPFPYNKYCFRTGICENKCITFEKKYNDLFLNTDVFVLEICSRKKYIHNGFYLHHLCVDTLWNFYKNTDNEIKKTYVLERQNDNEIEEDIKLIKKLLLPRKIIIVSHYNSKMNGKVFESRDNLINTLQVICKNQNIPFINPTDILNNYNQEEVIQNDLGHYTDFGLSKFTEFINMYIEKNFN